MEDIVVKLEVIQYPASPAFIHTGSVRLVNPDFRLDDQPDVRRFLQISPGDTDTRTFQHLRHFSFRYVCCPDQEISGLDPRTIASGPGITINLYPSFLQPIDHDDGAVESCRDAIVAALPGNGFFRIVEAVFLAQLKVRKWGV